MSSLLVIDDDPSVAMLVQKAIDLATTTLLTAATAAEGCRMVEQHRPDAIVLDVLLPDQTGLEVFERIRRIDARLPVIFVTARGNSGTAIEAMQHGALDFLVKPIDLVELRRLVSRALELRSSQNTLPEVRDSADLSGGDDELLVGRSPAMQQVYKTIGRVASQDVTVLLTGETGTGKELVARAIHQYSRRSAGPFHSVYCATTSEMALEIDLFGHERHAIAGIERKRIGRIEQSAGGTIFFDEIAGISSTIQGQLVRLLQDQVCERIGDTQAHKADVRVIASSTHNLEKLVAEGRFRADLYYLLSGFRVNLPSLRERPDDMATLALHFVMQFNHEFGKRIARIEPAALAYLKQYDWPGNIRELQSVLKQALVRASGSVLMADFLPERITTASASRSAVSVANRSSVNVEHATDWREFVPRLISMGCEDVYALAQSELDRHVLALVLRHTAGNQAKAAKLLGMTRSSLRGKLRASGLSIDHSIDVVGDAESALIEPLGELISPFSKHRTAE